MNSLSPADLIAELSKVVDPSFASDAIKSYVEMQQRFWAGDWKPAELDGGRLCEAVSRAVYQLDTGVVTNSLLPGAICDQLAIKNANHKLGDKDRSHICKAIAAVYKFRSDRGPVHISPTHTANHIDSVFVLHAGKWILAEFLRLAWNQDRDEIARVIEQLAQLDHSLIHELDGVPMVTATGLTTAEEILVLLHHADGYRLSRKDIHTTVKNRTADAVNKAIRKLDQDKEVRVAANGDIAIVPRGQTRVMTKIVPKLNTGK
jgi:hypothetical protein